MEDPAHPLVEPLDGTLPALEAGARAVRGGPWARTALKTMLRPMVAMSDPCPEYWRSRNSSFAGSAADGVSPRGRASRAPGAH